MYRIASNKPTLVSDSHNIIYEKKAITPKTSVPELLPKGKFGYNALWNIWMSPVWYFK